MPVPIVTIFGGSGFLGRHVAQRMAREGWRVRVAVRRPDEAGFVRPYGVVGQVEPIQANVRDEASTRAAIVGAEAVVNCVGILGESGAQSFGAVMDEGAGRIARIAAEAGVSRLVHVSAIGADPASDSHYAAAKGRGEAAVRAAFPGAVILRPSIMFGDGDGFFNRFGRMAQLLPVVPLVGARTRFQPVYVDDVAAAAAGAAASGAAAGVYELGGPEAASFRTLMERMLRIIQRRRLLIGLPFWLARIMAWAFGLVPRLTRGLVPNTVLTGDQVRQLARDNVLSPGSPGLEALGVRPTAMEAILDSYLYVYRPSGQFDAIKASAANLRPRT